MANATVLWIDLAQPASSRFATQMTSASTGNFAQTTTSALVELRHPRHHQRHSLGSLRYDVARKHRTVWLQLFLATVLRVILLPSGYEFNLPRGCTTRTHPTLTIHGSP